MQRRQFIGLVCALLGGTTLLGACRGHRPPPPPPHDRRPGPPPRRDDHRPPPPPRDGRR